MRAGQLGSVLLLGLGAGSWGPGPVALPAWKVAPAAEDSLKVLWARSVAARREAVACLGGTVGPDTVYIERALPLPSPSDSLTADAELSLSDCGPPEWVGTAHTHVRSTDGEEPATQFSPGDRTVMSLWSTRWGRSGAFCVLYSEKRAHCEVYPPASNPR